MSPTPRNGRHATTKARNVPVTTALLERRARELDRHLPGAVAGHEKAVHQARVASRRLREAVPVLAGNSKRGRKAARKIRKLTRAFGIVREMDVTMGILDELARRPEIPRSSLEDLRAHVIAERDRRREAMHERIAAVNTAKLQRRLAEVGKDLSSLVEGSWREALAKRIDARARRLAAAVQSTGQVYAPERLHRVRIAAKKLRYGLELAADAGVAAARPLVATLKRTQDDLGRLNDLHVIQEHVARVQTDPPARQGATDGGLDAISRTLEEECRHLHGRYVKRTPALLELAAVCRSSLLGPQRPGGRKPIKMTRAADPRPAAAKRA